MVMPSIGVVNVRRSHITGHNTESGQYRAANTGSL
jgi:hypothetical protein